MCAQRHTGRDIGFDDTSDDIDGWTLGGQNHVHTHGTSFLGDTCDRCLDLLAGLHDEIAVLVDDDDDIRQVLVVEAAVDEFLRVETACDELLVVVL